MVVVMIIVRFIVELKKSKNLSLMNPIEHLLSHIRVQFERRRQQPVTRGVWESRMKFYAEMRFVQDPDDFVVPTYEEWLGLNLLERDGELKRRKR